MKRFAVAIVMFLGTLATGFAALSVPITVREPANEAVTNYPVTVMVPLPYGAYQDVASFRLVNAGNADVPAQFIPLVRHWYRDQSIRFVQVHFLADVAAKGTASYTLKDDGPGAQPASPVTVLESGTDITVNTGALKLVVKKSGFNMFDQVFLEPGDIPVIASSANQGAVLTDRANLLNWLSSRTLDSVCVEEAGPIRAVLRFEGYTDTRDSLNQKCGFIVRIYAYAGQRMVKVDMGLINGERRAWGYPMYFRDFSIVTPLQVTAPTVRAQRVGGVYSSGATGGRKLMQWDVDVCRITNGSNQLLQADSGSPCGWMDVSDATKGAMVAIRNFWQTYPNGFETDGNGVLSARLWPKGKHSYTYYQSYNMHADSSDLYWLDDMMANRKELLYYFHGANESDAALASRAHSFQWNPVASVPFSWHRQCNVTLDFGGYMPAQAVAEAPVCDTLEYKTRLFDKTSVHYGFGWNQYLINDYKLTQDPNRRYTCSPGDWPNSNAEYVISGKPGHYFYAQSRGLGEINLRKVWSPGWKLKDNPATEERMGLIAYCAGSMRSNCWDNSRFLTAKPFIDSTHPVGWSPRDYAHGWFYHIEEYYNYSGDPWIRDAMNFWCEYYKSYYKESNISWARNNDSTNLYFVDGTRAVGHALGSFLMAMRVTGTKCLETTEAWIHRMKLTQSKKYGCYALPSEGPFQVGFVVRSLASYMQMVEGYRPVSYAEAFSQAYGAVEWNTYFADYAYYWVDSNGYSTGKDTIKQTGAQIHDEVAWMIFQTKRQPFIQSAEKLWNPGSYTYYDQNVWNGNHCGRYTVGFLRDLMLKHYGDTLAPSAINGLTAVPKAYGAEVSFSAPQDARKYWIQWDVKPIKEGPDTLLDSAKWWMARPGNFVMNARASGETETLPVSMPVGTNGTVYVAVRSFDSLNNLSPISNLYRLTVNVTDTFNLGIENKIRNEAFRLDASPNPFNPAISITVVQGTSIRLNGPARLAVYNVRGQQVADLTGMLKNRKVVWNASAIPSGMYVVKYTADDKMLTRKIMLIK